MTKEIDNSDTTVNRNLFEQVDCNIVETFDDIFDILDENLDLLEYTTKELNRYFQSGHLNYIIQEEEIIDRNYFNDTNPIQPEQQHDKEEKQTDDDDDNNDDDDIVLSQKLSQLSTNNEDETNKSNFNKRTHESSNLSSPIVNTKKMKPSTNSNMNNNTETEQEQIPIYLLTTNPSFIQMAANICKNTSSIKIEDVQQVALLMHRIADVEIKRLVTKVYFKSVTGTLKEPECTLIEVDRRVWPLQVKSLMLTHQKSYTTTTATTTSTSSNETTTEQDNENQQIICQTLLQQQLKDMRQQIEEYQKQLVDKKNSLLGFTSAIQESIQNYVQQKGIKPLKTKRNLKVALLEYDYESEILQRKYVQENPNDYQLQVAKRLCDTRRDFEKSKRELFELKQRLFYNKLLSPFNSTQLSNLNIYKDRLKCAQKIQQHFLNHEEHLLDYTKLDSMAVRIQDAERILYRNQVDFDSELSDMWKNHRNLVRNQGMPTTLNNLIEQRLQTIKNRWRTIYDYRVDYYLRNSYDALDRTDFNEIQQNMKVNSYSTNIIIDTKHPLTDKQLEIVNRGPMYVPPGQIYISTTYQSMDDIVKQQYAPLKHQLAGLFAKYHLNLALSMEIQNKLFDKFKQLFTITIPSGLQQRAIYEKNLLQSIRTSLNENNLILRRTADNMNTFYLGNRQDFETKANRYLSRSDVYDVILSMTDEIDKDLQIKKQLNEMSTSMNVLLEKLREHKSLDKKTIDSFLIDPTKIKLPYLYFLADVSKGKNISVVPFISAENSATSKIGNFLNRLLRPIVDNILKSTSFRDEFDFVQKLNNYVHTKQCLRSTTLFCKITIMNMSTLEIHERMLDKVVFFLRDNLLSNKVDQITMTTIKNLLYLFLKNNIFCYQNKIYKFEKGSPNTMALTETLSNIYLYLWQNKTLTLCNTYNELFGRYKNQIFFTWNKSNVSELDQFLQDEVRQKDPNVNFHVSISSSMRYFNAYVENREGKLYTRVFHDTNIQSYTLPYVVNHAKLAYSDWLRTALIRAICLCSIVEDFHQERIYLELTCLVNGLSLIFVEAHVQNFFNYFHATEMRYSMNQIAYERFRRQWFDYIDMQHELTDELQKFDDKGNLVHLNYLYDLGPRCQFSEEFHQLWSDYFKNHPSLCKDKLKILLTPKHFHTLNTLLTKEDISYSIQ